MTVEEDSQSPAPSTDEQNTCNDGPNGDGNDVEADGTTQGEDEDNEADGAPKGSEDENKCSEDTLGGTVGHPLLDERGLYTMPPLEGSMHGVQVCMHSGVQSFPNKIDS